MHLHAYDMYNVVTSGSMTSDWRVVQTVNLADWNPGPSAKAADIVAWATVDQKVMITIVDRLRFMRWGITSYNKFFHKA